MNVQREAAPQALLPRVHCQFHGRVLAFVATKCGSSHVEFQLA